MKQATSVSLRDRRNAETRNSIVDTAMAMLSNPSGEAFSHEAIAKKLGIGPRTVYRYFPHRADLLQAAWLQLREATQTRFPEDEAELVPLMRAAFRNFDEHEALVRATLSSAEGSEVRNRGAIEGRSAFRKSLDAVTKGWSERERRQLIAVCLAIYSAPFWQMLRDRGELTGPEARESGAWAMEAILKAAQRSRSAENGSKKPRV